MTKVKKRSPLKKHSLGFPKALMVIGLTLFCLALMFGLGYKVGYDTATIMSPPCPLGKTIPWQLGRGLVIL